MTRDFVNQFDWYLELAQEHPCFYEYFVEGARGILTTNIDRRYELEYGLVQGTEFTYLPLYGIR